MTRPEPSRASSRSLTAALLALTLVGALFSLSGCGREGTSGAGPTGKTSEANGSKPDIVTGTDLKGAFAGFFDPFNYTRALQDRIRENWKVAPALSTKCGVVTFAIDHRGEVSEVKVKQSSGSPEYDKSMVAAVNDAVPLPPLVASAPAKVKVEFTFDERLFRGIATPEDLQKIVAEQGAALERDPADCQALTRRGLAHRRLRNYDKAIEDYRVVISKSGESISSYIERAKCYLYIDDYKKALADCLACEKLAPTLAKPYTLASVAQLGLGHLDLALKALNTAISLSESDPEAWALRANCHNLALKHREAIADASKAIELDPDYASPYAYRGDAYEAVHEYDRALQDYSKNVSLDPSASQAYLRRTELLAKLGQYDKAVFDATECIKLAPTCGEAYYYRAQANDALGLKAQAAADFARAKQLGF
ncbi:MAG: TonB family protein [Cyanobacteria bacterium SZAS LIN-3]|nr:TonB family protein [Cyanobacteria bacterium SZAS LIN-3]